MAMTDEERNKAIQNAYDQALSLTTAEKPVYAGTYDQQIKDLYDQISNREKFNYDVNADPLYQMYRDKYTQQGKLAMKDTMGQAAALTGGYGSSYGQAVGQQQYDAYLQQLNDVIPELYGMAYDQYKDAGDQMQDQYAMLGNLQADEYGKYRDALGDFNAQQQYNYNLWTDAYNRAMNEENTAYNREQDAYAKQQDSYNQLYKIITASGYSPSDEELARAGMSRGQADALIAAYQMSIQPRGGSGGGGSGGGSSSKNSTSNGTGNSSSLEKELRQLAAAGAVSATMTAYASAYANEVGGISGGEARGLAKQVARETGRLDTEKYRNGSAALQAAAKK